MVANDSGSADEALGWVQAGRHYDVAVVDTNVPGIGATALSAGLHECDAGRELPVVAMTNLGERRLCTIDAPAASVSKPVKTVPLRNALVCALGSDPEPTAAEPPAERTPAERTPAERTPAERTPAVTTPAETTPAGRPLRILLAEDNSINQLVNRLMASKLGHQVDVIDNGIGVLEALRSTSYDVVLMDVQMPGMDGLEATRRIRSDFPSSQQPWVIALTASVDLGDRAAGRAVRRGWMTTSRSRSRPRSSSSLSTPFRYPSPSTAFDESVIAGKLRTAVTTVLTALYQPWRW